MSSKISLSLPLSDLAEPLLLEVEPKQRLNDQELHNDAFSWFIEAQRFCELAWPTVAIQLSFNVPGFLVAAYIGRQYGSLHLSGFSLANLTGNLFTLSILQGLFSAADTLAPKAYANGEGRQVGVIAMRGYLAALTILMPGLAILFLFMKPLLVALGQNEEASEYASEYYQVYTLSLPFYALYMAIWKFLAAQHVMRPLVLVSLFNCAIVLPSALYLLPEWFGFVGTAAAVVVNQVTQALLLLLYLWYWQPYDKDTWPGLKAWRDAIEWRSFRDYVSLGLGGILSSSGWIYWETIAMLIGSAFGPIVLASHTIPTQMLSVIYMAPKGIGVALSIRLGSLLAIDVRRAQLFVTYCVLLCIGMFGAVSVVLYFAQDRILHRFSDDPDVIEGSEAIWLNVCIYFFITAMFGVNMGCATGLGMQWVLGTAMISILWAVGLPVTYFSAILRGGGLRAVWSCLWPPYLAVNVVMVLAFTTRDWNKIANSRQVLDRPIESLMIDETSESSTEVRDFVEREPTDLCLLTDETNRSAIGAFV